MRITIRLLMLLLPVLLPVSIATPGVVVAGPVALQALAARLALETLPELNILATRGDATQVHYTVASADGLAPVVGVVQDHLLAEGWVSHPNVTEPPAPVPGRAQRQLSFVQGSDLLELRAAQLEGERISLRLTLISLEAPPQVAEAL
jgi:hypothetical protein